MEKELFIKEVAQGIYLMDEAHEATGYLVIGEDKACVIDTMNGYNDLHQAVRKITDKPLMVINTHGHPDHIFGNVYFDRAFMHPADLPLARTFIEDPEFVSFCEEHHLRMPPFDEVREGDVFDLGGRHLEVYELPGHTPGGIVLLLREDRILFTGDSVNHHLWMQLEGCAPPDEFVQSLDRILFLEEKADRILHGHARDFDDISLLRCLRIGAEELALGRTENDRPYRYFAGEAAQHPFSCLPGRHYSQDDHVICYNPGNMGKGGWPLRDRTLKTLLEDPAIADIAPEAISKWDLSKEPFYLWTLKEMADKMGWQNLERGFARLLRAAQTDYFFPLYSEEECQNAPEKRNRNLVYFPSDDPSADGRPFILLIPGGGFVNVWNLTEGWPVAQHFNARGYHVLILTYQVKTERAAVKAMDDIARAMEIIRSNRDRFRVDPQNYITCGFSAGGYLVCLWNTEKGYSAFGLPKPRACFPVYPVTSYRLMAAEEWNEGEDPDQFAKNSVGVSMAEACNSCFEIPLHVAGFPPTAIFLAAEDQLVPPDHSRNLARALEEAGIPCHLEIGPTGGHGFSDGTGMCMEGWPERAIDWFEKL